MFKKMSAFIAALTITASTFGALPINNIITANAASADKVDLSIEHSSYFPEIFNQRYGSCVSCASTLYQLTYEVRKKYAEEYKINFTETMSPAFSFDHLNNGGDEGSLLKLAYMFLERKGSLIEKDSPYYAPCYDLNKIETRAEKLTKALKTRVCNVDCITTDYSNEDRTIEQIKEKLRNGKVVTTEGNFNYDYFSGDKKYCATTNTNEKAYVQNTELYTDYIGHAFTIVGYDDNIKVNYNGKELTGAFKILNSWGTGWGNDGYMWIMYDAFYQRSKCGIKCEDDDRYRVSAFTSGRFYTVDVDFKDIKLVAEADVETSNQSGISLWTTKLENGKTLATQERYDWDHFYGKNEDNDVAYSGSVVDDLNTFCDDDFFTNKSYKIEVRHTPKDDPYIKVNSISLRDDLGNVVAQKTIDNDSNGGYIDLDLKRGDINYDGVINSADTEMIRKHIKDLEYLKTIENPNDIEKDKITEYSTLQKILMDVNNDGRIDDIDAETANFIDTGRYITESGVVYTGWHLINNGYYFLDENGVKVTNTFIDDENKNETYFVNADGLCVKDSLFVFEGDRYCADEFGYIIKNREYDAAIDKTGVSRIFYFDENGKALIGWNADKTKYYSEAGMYTGWHLIDGENIFFDENGVRAD